MHIKFKSCNSPEGQQIYLKKTLTQVFSCEYFKRFGKLFYRKTLLAAFELGFIIRKEFKKRKLAKRLIAFALIGLLHVQIQEPASRSATTREFFCHILLNFINTKYLKPEVNDDLSICVDEGTPCGLSVTRDIKIYQCCVIKR